MESTWEILYRRFRQLKTEWANREPIAFTLQAFNSVMETGKAPLRELRAIRELGYQTPPVTLIDDSIELARSLKGTPTGNSENDPFVDVYQAALAMERRYDWKGDDGVRKAFRGQRDATWTTNATLFRNREEAPMVGVSLEAEFRDEDRKSTRLNSSHSQISYAV